MTRILLTRLGGVGDLLFIEPTIRALYEKHYPCEIVFRTYKDYEGVLDYHPCISDIVYDTNEYRLGYPGIWIDDGTKFIQTSNSRVNGDWSSIVPEYWGNVNPRFDYHFDFQVTLTGKYLENLATHAVHAYANHANVKLHDIVPQVHYLKRETPNYPLVVQLTSAEKHRSLDKNQPVLDSLLKYKPYFIGEEKLEYSHFVSIINNCNLFVGTDSCGVIIARGLNKKVIGIYKNKARLKVLSFDKMETFSEGDKIYKLAKAIVSAAGN